MIFSFSFSRKPSILLPALWQFDKNVEKKYMWRCRIPLAIYTAISNKQQVLIGGRLPAAAPQLQIFVFLTLSYGLRSNKEAIQ
jgi:hypothetical protein